MTTEKKRRRPLTAKVRRGLQTILPEVRTERVDRRETEEVLAALLWIEQFAATGGSR